jgi:hypothetical protein
MTYNAAVLFLILRALVAFVYVLPPIGVDDFSLARVLERSHGLFSLLLPPNLL